MLHSLLFAPFADADRQAHYDALQAALAAEDPPVPTVLLGNFTVADAAFDAVVIRPRSVTALQLMPGQGELHIDAAALSSWHLGGQELENPLATFQQQQRVLAAWLSADLGPTTVAPPDITGLAVFSAAVEFGPAVETQLRQLPEADTFGLLRQAAHLPRRLWNLTRVGIDLPETTLVRWFEDLAGEAATGEDDVLEEVSELVAPMGFWEYRARQLWRWLGAEDVPHDQPYGFSPPDSQAASQDEKARLELIRQQVRAELQEQNRAAAAREAAREQTIAQLQAQLRQASAVAPESAELQARLAAETREKAALAEAVRQAQAELAARNRQLDARIEQLGQALQQLQARPAPAAPAASAPAPLSAAAPVTPATARLPRRVSAPPRPVADWQVRWHRVAVVAAVAGGLGWGVWGAIHLAGKLISPPKPQITVPRQRNQQPKAQPAPAAAAVDSTDDFLLQREEPVIQDSTVTPTQSTDSSEIMPEMAEPDLDDTSPDGD
ncbi:hypothetical protein [Hymenobacter cellulosilyticus]|uniref:NERD domain-containing protein n=1 Tax=Hymenobacter cellulosilyticus TaxID=2932248 RepID=A0A8T9Q0N4_9BACT|nr:hypothetical protein [Hymenobacter cellulosilyticus]UOQ70994.1 hypothetical protein MUN79_20300 [Hymenobacter cellulosilyticus]